MVVGGEWRQDSREQKKHGEGSWSQFAVLGDDVRWKKTSVDAPPELNSAITKWRKRSCRVVAIFAQINRHPNRKSTLVVGHGCAKRLKGGHGMLRGRRCESRHVGRGVSQHFLDDGRDDADIILAPDCAQDPVLVSDH